MMSTDRLKQEFANGLHVTREHLLRMAAILTELDNRGAQVDGDKHLLKMLRRIGKGELLVDVVVRFAGRPYILSRVGVLPADKQEEVLAKDNKEVDEMYTTRPHKNSDPAKGYSNPNGHGDDGRPVVASLKEMALAGTPADVAEMCLELIENSEDPVAVVERLKPELDRFKVKPKRKPAMRG